MLLKTIIVILLIGLLISLTSALVFLFRDVGSTKRTLHSLGVRITLAAALMATTIYGFLSGELKIGAPWDSRKFNQMQVVEAASDKSPQENEAIPIENNTEPEEATKVE